MSARGRLRSRWMLVLSSVATCASGLALAAPSVPANAVQGARSTTQGVYDQAVLSDGPIAYWPLDDVSGSAVADLAGGPGGTMSGNATLGSVAGPITGSTALHSPGGACDGVNLNAYGSALEPEDGLTVEAWIEPDGAEGGQQIIVVGDPFKFQNSGYHLYGQSSDALFGMSNWHAGAYDYSILPSQWNYVVVTADPSGLNMYVNGLLRESVSSVYYAGKPIYADQNASIGWDEQDCFADMPAYLGNIANVAIYDHALNNGQIEKHYLAAEASHSAYVALGDSFASGEGAKQGTFLLGTSFRDKETGGTTGCHRSTTAWANTVARHEDFTPSQWSFRACSGAESADLYLQNTDYAEYGEIESPQMDWVNLSTRLTSLSMGGNDVGFVDIFSDCVYDPAGQAPGKIDCRRKHSDAWNRAETGLNSLTTCIPVGDGCTTLAQEYVDIAERMAAHGTLVVAPYPKFFGGKLRYYEYDPFKKVLSCVVGFGWHADPLMVSFNDAQWLNSLSERGDDIIASQVKQANKVLRDGLIPVHVVVADTLVSEFNGNRLCDAHGADFNGVILNDWRTTPDQRSFHPNADGQRDYADAVIAALDR